MSNPIVTVVVPHHLNENDKYLNWCLKAILATEGIPIEVLAFSSAPQCPDVPENVTLRHDTDPAMKSCSAKYMAGYRMSHPSSKYMMFISDDVIVSKHTIKELADTLGDLGAIINPASNCDATTRYRTEYTFSNTADKWTVPLKCSLEDALPYLEGNQGVIEKPLERRVIIDSGWVSFYCTMIPKVVMEAVGELDERLDVRHNDVDYCQRARALGAPSLINLGAFALHFGDKTIPKCTTEAQYAEADKVFQEKYSIA